MLAVGERDTVVVPAEKPPDRKINAHEIVSVPNEIQNFDKKSRLIVAFEDRGWTGPPVLVEWNENKGGYVAWNGSHRIAAASKAAISIPVRELDGRKLSSAIKRLKIERKRMDDEDRIRVLSEAGYNEEAALLDRELRQRDVFSVNTGANDGD